MARNFELDIAGFQRALMQSPEAAKRGAQNALDDIRDDWVRQSRDVAPLDSSNLRRQITGESDDLMVTVMGNATSSGTGRFNYGYFIHEQGAGGRGLRTPGTVMKFLDQPAEQSTAKWQRWLDEEIQKELRNEGW